VRAESRPSSRHENREVTFSSRTSSRPASDTAISRVGLDQSRSWKAVSAAEGDRGAGSFSSRETGRGRATILGSRAWTSAACGARARWADTNSRRRCGSRYGALVETRRLGEATADIWATPRAICSACPAAGAPLRLVEAEDEHPEERLLALQRRRRGDVPAARSARQTAARRRGRGPPRAVAHKKSQKTCPRTRRRRGCHVWTSRGAAGGHHAKSERSRVAEGQRDKAWARFRRAPGR